RTRCAGPPPCSAARFPEFASPCPDLAPVHPCVALLVVPHPRSWGDRLCGIGPTVTPTRPRFACAWPPAYSAARSPEFAWSCPDLAAVHPCAALLVVALPLAEEREPDRRDWSDLGGDRFAIAPGYLKSDARDDSSHCDC